MQAAAAAATLITPPTHSCRRHLIGNRLLRLQLLHLRVSHGGVRDTRWRGMQRQDVPGSEARGSGGRPASEEIDRDYLEYNDPARVFPGEACDDLGGEFCEAEYQNGIY
ncbi:hypothetical protein MUK42_27242 [Musa troglodytarum]|uniref:Uncharacterized protein n=1 Tax=Musa troglodytarum TaxID=320322 RepID=A0A9E7EXJ2_9LILI|nr:hypothetical protein MUK42_27242 [Musa troglodytarum]